MDSLIDSFEWIQPIAQTTMCTNYNVYNVVHVATIKLIGCLLVQASPHRSLFWSGYGRSAMIKWIHFSLMESYPLLIKRQ